MYEILSDVLPRTKILAPPLNIYKICNLVDDYTKCSLLYRGFLICEIFLCKILFACFVEPGLILNNLKNIGILDFTSYIKVL